MAQTAVEWLEDIIKGSIQDKLVIAVLTPIFQQAKEMEKGQMSEVYTEGYKRKAYISEILKPIPEWNEKVPEDFDTYYENTYGE